MKIIVQVLEGKREMCYCHLYGKPKIINGLVDLTQVQEDCHIAGQHTKINSIPLHLQNPVNKILFTVVIKL